MPHYLNRERWYDWMPETGKFRLKRVSATMEAQFPKPYRIILRDQGTSGLVKHLMREKGIGLAEAWRMVKDMVNK